MRSFSTPVFKSKQDAREILGEIVDLRWRRKRGEMISPAEELLMDLLMNESSVSTRGMRKQFIALAGGLGLYPVPNWFIVKRRITPVDGAARAEDFYHKICWFSVEHLLDGR